MNAGTNDNGTRTVFLESDIVRATLKGKFKLLELPSSISTMLSNSLPAYFPVPTLKEVNKSAVQDFVWFVNFQKNVRPIQSIIPQLVVAPNTSFSGKFLSEKRGLKQTYLPHQYYTMVLRTMEFNWKFPNLILPMLACWLEQ